MYFERYEELEESLCSCPFCGNKMLFHTEQSVTTCGDIVEELSLVCKKCHFKAVFPNSYLGEITFSSSTEYANKRMYSRVTKLWNRLKNK